MASPSDFTTNKGFQQRVIDRDRGYKKVLSDVLEAAGGPNTVVVGIRQGDGGGKRTKTVGKPGARRAVPGKASDPTLAEVAAMNEFGFERTPERSFMRSTFDEQEGNYVNVLAKGLGLVVDGKESVPTVLGILGERMKDDVQEKITTLQTPPNAAQTIAAKGSDNPLIDSGRMRQAIGYDVRKTRKFGKAIDGGGE